MQIVTTNTGGLAMQFTESEKYILINALHTAADTYRECAKDVNNSPALEEQFERQIVEALALVTLIEQE